MRRTLVRLAACCGNGQFGRLGNGSQANELFLRVLPQLQGVQSVAAGGAHTAVVTGERSAVRVRASAAASITSITCIRATFACTHLVHSRMLPLPRLARVQRRANSGRLGSTTTDSWGTRRTTGLWR
jgi:hypothetical protein